MNVIYPKGSIITRKNDETKYCIINITDEEYECVQFPFGMILEKQKIPIKFDEVKELYFFGYHSKEYDEQLNKYISKKLNKVGD